MNESEILDAAARAVQEKLAKLATLDTADAIALELEAQGIKAMRTSPFSCAIAKYLKQDPEVQPVGLVGVSLGGVSLSSNDSRLTEIIQNPRVVADFIKAFDEGQYPELVDERWS